MEEHATDNAVDLLIFTRSDEELEKAAGGATCAHTYPGTGVATICQGTNDKAQLIAANVAKLPGPEAQQFCGVPIPPVPAARARRGLGEIGAAFFGGSKPQAQPGVLSID